MLQPINSYINYNQLINDIEKGSIKIPQFQRDFVWKKKESAKLLDSIIKGYPIGTFIIWKTKERLRSIKNVGEINFPETPSGDLVNYVLDGQQRMTSLYCAIKGIKIKNKINEIIDYSEIYVDLEALEDEEIVVIDVELEKKSQYIKLVELLEGGLSLAKKYDEKYHKKLEDYANRFKTYSFSLITNNEIPIEVATEIFTRINIGGKSLSVFEIMVAKTFNSEKNFDLSEKYKKFMEKMSSINYDTIPDSTILQSVAICMVKECSKNQILKLNKDKFIEIWDEVVEAIENTIEHFRHFYRIPVSQLLPYDGLIIPFTYFFFKHKALPSLEQQKYLQDYFWRTVLNSRFSSSLESKVAQDIKKIDAILKNELPKYQEGVDISIEELSRNGYFNAGKSYIKGLLCILAYQIPKSFNNNSLININNDWLKQANSKNYHHFFPKSYLKKIGEEDFYINHIANITIVDDFLNKRIIKDQAPNKYMTLFLDNIDLKSTMNSHLITDLDEYGIWNNDYEKFYIKRLEQFSFELEKRLIIIKGLDRVKNDII